MEVRNILLSMALVAILALVEFASMTTAQASDGQVTTTGPIQIHINGNDSDPEAGKSADVDGSSVGMIVGIIIAILVVLTAIAVILIYLVRTKRFASNKSEKDRAAQVQMTSARNAGVYVDLVTPEVMVKDAESPETEKLKRQDDEPEDV